MCAINLWAVNAAAFTTEFHRFTTERLSVAPVAEEMSIGSSRVRSSSRVFTLTTRMCDCDSLIGRRADPALEEEISAERWLGWLRELPNYVPHVSRIAVLRAWNPGNDVITPQRSRGIRIGELDETILRDIRDDTLLTLDYPRTW
ncbi:hypothetical protein [Gulosibacter sp. ACHW.36C]|uniref:Uncharacterized protein n=1 Tax=Gulosibacter sediminis TaxID=1729695 RepID=A0ABY4MZ99_9MICO|nr:hypothetical protein [Gulosibacter sediminis]UQN15770.1 hypothetical protein M3M28_04790 [Gulosibacter sediminis]